MTKQTDYDAHRAMEHSANGWQYATPASNEDIRHADHMEPPLQVRDGWHALAVIFWAYIGVLLVAPASFGLGKSLGDAFLVYLRGLV